jgi:two-component system, NarL family, sensor histidine kinase DegS
MFRFKSDPKNPARVFETIVERAINPIFVITTTGTVIYVNPAYEIWSGYSKKELIGKNLFDIAGYLQIKEIQDALRSGYYWSGGIEQKHKSGTGLNAFLIIHPDSNKIDSSTLYIGTLIDLTEHRIFDAEKKYGNILDITPDGICIIQRDRIVFANRAMVQIAGCASPAELASQHYLAFVAPQSRHTMEDIYRKGLDGDESIGGIDVKLQSGQGSTTDVDMNASPTIWNRDRAVLVTVRDVTERKRIEREQAEWLWEQEMLSSIERQLVSTVDLPEVLDMISNQAKLLARADLAGIITIDGEKDLYRWLSVRGEQSAIQKKFLSLGASAKRFYHEREGRVIYSLVDDQEYNAAEFPLFSDERIVTVVQFPLTKGAIVFGHLNIGYRTRHDFSPRMFKLLQMFAERATVAIMNAELYDQLLKQTKQLQQMFDVRLLAQEEERRRIAAELHDSLGQLLTSIKLHFNVLEDSDVVRGEDGIQQIREIKGLLDNAISEARNISYDLRPSILDDFGLVPALEVLCDKFGIRSGLKINFQAHNLEARLHNRIETALYRIAQEALNNVQKHAKASEVSVQVIRTPTTVNLVIEDNGKGFDPEEAERHQYPGTNGYDYSGMGLVSMKERVQSLQGTLTIDSTIGKGTDILVEIPLSEVNSQ